MRILFFLLLPVMGLRAQQVKSYQVPVLKENEFTAVMRITVDVPAVAFLKQVNLKVSGADKVIIYCNNDSNYLTTEKRLGAAWFGSASSDKIEGNLRLRKGVNYLWIGVSLKANADLLARVGVQVNNLVIGDKRMALNAPMVTNRVGVAVRRFMQDNVHTSRIPGIATAANGDLLAIYDARYESARDLQGDMDIALSRSTDKGASWQAMQVVLDKGKWGNLPEKFNGVSDACILTDKKTGAIYVAGLWMHGVLDSNGVWTEGLTEDSKDWNHQWRNKGSQPGTDVKQSAQFLLTKSADNGKTWSEPLNLTPLCKRAEWWLWAPAPGAGITLKDGTLVFPTQGRDQTGKPFSNITYSKDGGKTWVTSNPAVEGSTTECMAVELSDGSVMLNMRTNANKGITGPGNGRTVAVTKDLGKTWLEHPTSRKALPEPVCMASIARHGSVLLFLNPHSTTQRNNITLQVSYDDGRTWPVQKHILLDELSGRGYSCITSVDNKTIGLLYESSQAQLVFQQIDVKEITD